MSASARPASRTRTGRTEYARFRWIRFSSLAAAYRRRHGGTPRGQSPGAPDRVVVDARQGVWHQGRDEEVQAVAGACLDAAEPPCQRKIRQPSSAARLHRSSFALGVRIVLAPSPSDLRRRVDALIRCPLDMATSLLMSERSCPHRVGRRDRFTLRSYCVTRGLNIKLCSSCGAKRQVHAMVYCAI